MGFKRNSRTGKFTKFDSKALEELIKTFCYDVPLEGPGEGCCCGEPKGHLGLHKCAAEGCDCEWD